MVRSRLPVPSLLGLFGALLMLSPDLLRWSPEGLTILPVTDAEVQKALGFAVEQYNQEIGCRTYFKQLRLQQAYIQGDTRDQYNLKVELVKTICRKKHGTRMQYERIQKCDLRPGKPEKRICYFKVSPPTPPKETLFKNLACTIVPPP